MYKPSPWELSQREKEIKDKYLGAHATLNGNSATIKSTMQGKFAVVQSSTESGEADWFNIEKGMTQSDGIFRLEGGHRAVPVPKGNY